MVDNYQKRLTAVREREHDLCFVCDPDNPRGFGLDFQAYADGRVVAVFACALYLLQAELFQDGKVLATASGKFMKRSTDDVNHVNLSSPSEE